MKRIALMMMGLAATGFGMTKLSPQDIRERLEVSGDIYVMDASGKKIIAGPERTNYWRANRETGVLEGNWGSQWESGGIHVHHRWEVTPEGTIKVVMEEFEPDPKRQDDTNGKLLEKKEFVVQNLEPLIWEVKSIKSAHYIVRYVPSLREVATPLSVDSLPIAGTGISMSDSEGYLWGDDIHFSGRYAGITSHRGTLALSYAPFAGAKEMGFAEGNQIVITADKNFKITLKATSSFLPAGVTAKVYAVYAPTKRTRGFRSLRTYDTTKEARIQEILKE